MDIILVTHKLTGVVGKVGPLVLYLYYIMAAFVKRFLMPSFGQVSKIIIKIMGLTFLKVDCNRVRIRRKIPSCTSKIDN
jgi:hypothetical protein